MVVKSETAFQKGEDTYKEVPAFLSQMFTLHFLSFAASWLVFHIRMLGLEHRKHIIHTLASDLTALH